MSHSPGKWVKRSDPRMIYCGDNCIAQVFMVSHGREREVKTNDN